MAESAAGDPPVSGDNMHKIMTCECIFQDFCRCQGRVIHKKRDTWAVIFGGAKGERGGGLSC